MPVPALLAQKGARQSVIQYPKGLKINPGLSISKSLESWSKPERLSIAVIPARKAHEVLDSREPCSLRSLNQRHAKTGPLPEHVLGSTPLRMPRLTPSDRNLLLGAVRKGLLGQTICAPTWICSPSSATPRGESLTYPQNKTTQHHTSKASTRANRVK